MQDNYEVLIDEHMRYRAEQALKASSGIISPEIAYSNMRKRLLQDFERVAACVRVVAEASIHEK